MKTSDHPLVFVFIFITLCLLPMMILRDFTPNNELRYLSIADEAIEDGNIFAFTLHGEPYADKPPLYLWLVMLSKMLLGKHSMLLLSMFSFIPALVIISLMDRWLALENSEDRVSVALMMMTSMLFLGLSVFLRMDMLMSMFIFLALYSFYMMYEGHGNRKRQELLFPVWIFLALFTKGPIGLLMPPVAIICFLLVKRKGREIGKYLGWKTWGIIAGFCLIWFTGVYLDGGKSYLSNLLIHQTFGRAVNSFHHKEPFYYYLVTVWYVVAPWCLLLVGSIAASLLKPKSGQRDDKEIFFCTVVLSSFVMLSSFSAKLAIYFAPVMPFMVMLFVELLKRTGWKKWMTVSLAIPQGLVILACLAALIVKKFSLGGPAVDKIFEDYSFASARPLWLAVGILLAGYILAMVQLFKGQRSRSALFMATFLLLAVYSASFVVPQLNDYIGYRNLCDTIPETDEVATVNLKRPESMDVYLRRPVSDYGKNFNTFYINEVAERTAEDGPLTLVVKTKSINSEVPLQNFVSGHRHWYIGPYCLVRVTDQDL